MSVYPGVVLGRGYAPIPPEPPVYPFDRMQVTWVGGNGDSIDLSRPRSGIFLTNEGLAGLSWPPFELGTSSSPARAGRRRRTVRVTERSAELPVYIYGEVDSLEFLNRWTRFQDSWDPLVPGLLTVTTPKEKRTLQLYFDADGEGSITLDPIYYGFSRTTIQATAEDKPYWEGESQTFRFVNGDPSPFFTADGNLYIAETTGLADAQVVNSGDVDTWPIYTIKNTEPSQALTVTIDLAGGTFTTPPIGSGQTLIINTETGSARLSNGVDKAGQVVPYDPRPVPKKSTMPLNITMSGFGVLTVEIPQRYWRAF